MVLSLRSSSNLTKYGSRNNSTTLRKERSIINGQEQKSINEQDFDTKFKQFCVQYNSWIIPNIKSVLYEPSPGGFPEIPSFNENINTKPTETIKKHHEKLPKDTKECVPAVLALFESCESQTGLHTIVFKNFKVDKGMLIALRKTIHNFETIRVLKLEHSQLQNTDLRTLKTVLQKNELITDLSINGNPNRFQNFYILLKNTHLKVISMKLCQINNRGVHLIANQLMLSAFDRPLISLDLSSNFISDDGAEPLANALRINRNLLFLNLADNWLTDIGCCTIMDVLKMFNLKHEEIVIRRHRIMNFLKKKTEMIELYKLKYLQKSTESVSQKSLTLNVYHKKSSRESSSKFTRDTISRSSKGQTSIGSGHKKGNIQKNHSADINMEFIMETVESEMRPDNHPFVRNCHVENNEIYCKGNLKLASLNMSYNKITISSLQKIIEVLQYQQLLSQAQEGLSNITLKGNLFPDYCSEMNDVNYLIQKSYSRRYSNASTESRRNSKRKRSGLSKVSII